MTKIVTPEPSMPVPSLRQYITGFVASIILTLGSYVLVINHAASVTGVSVLIVVFALVQFAIQLVFFLHLGTEAKPRWRLLSFVFMVMVVAILVGGSLWIMNNLNYRLTPSQVNQYLESQNGF